MRGSIVRKAILVSAIICASVISKAQQPGTPSPGLSSSSGEIEKRSKPYRILTSGKTITIRTTKNIKSVMVWTSAGHRILEEKNLKTSNYNFRITINEKLFFVMLQLSDGKIYSEKIGVQ